ncbi:MAG: diguanylate cyclase [Planctomycetes bacterium]|nr:diguanylate cyclase [Planctomycetota bacterium]
MSPSDVPLPKVLAIDDSELIHRLLRVRLQYEQLELHGSTKAEDGLRLARELRPDVILLDIEMEGMDGFHVLQVLKSDIDLQDIPVIFISATASMEDRVRALDLGAIDFVGKPFEVVELKARVRSALRVQHLVKMLAQRAQVDGLTGLWNRTYFDRRLLQEVSEATRHNRSVSLVMCDVDGFKRLNDERGHPFGDMVLERVAKILQGGRGSDVACRYGGEEFGIILPNTAAIEAIEVAERYRRAMEQEIWAMAPGMVITSSFGVAEFRNLGADAGVNDLVQAADGALYRAKLNGRNRVEAAMATHRTA